MLTKIENGKRILNDLDDFNIDDTMPNILKEFKFKYLYAEDSIRSGEKITTSIWEITDDFKVYLSYQNGNIESITLKTKENIHRYNRYKYLWYLNGSKEIGVNSDMIGHLMDTVREYWNN